MRTNCPMETATFSIRLEAQPSPAYRRNLVRSVIDAMDRGDSRIVIDCAAWRQLNLVLLSAIVGCADACAERDAAFELANVSDDMRRHIEALMLADRVGLTINSRASLA